MLNESAPLPFQLDEQPGEKSGCATATSICAVRAPQQRSDCAHVPTRRPAECSAAHDFIEIETPTLTRSTPKARATLVPARLQPGTFYALPQSPQLFKQLLMVAGMERYYQIARAYRDEGTSAPTASPEFTQLDIEMSYVEQDDVIALAEEILVALWRLIGVELTTPIPRITYAEAMRRYGSDKPDLRFEIELVECTDFFADTPFRVFQAPYVGAVVMSGGASHPRRTLDGWQEWAKQRGAKGLAYVLVNEDGTLGGPVAKNLSDDERGAGRSCRGQARRLRVLRSRTRQCATSAAGRSTVGDRHPAGPDPGPDDVVDPSTADWAFTWVVDAPLFEPVDDAAAAGDVAVGSGAWTAVHHAFTSPKPESVDALETDPGAALAYAYDIVCNGTRSAADRSASIAATSRSACSRSWASTTTRRRRSSASCSTPSRSGRRRMAVSRSAGTGSPPCWQANRPSVK